MGRGLRVLAGHRGRAPARRAHRPRRTALVGPSRGLPHGDPRAHEGADGQERAHRPRRRQGRVRGEDGRGRRRLPDVRGRAARRHRQRRRGRHRAAPAGRAPRRRRPYLVVAADKGTASFSDVANDIAVRPASGSGTRSRRAGRPATTTSGWGSPRAAHGNPCGAISAGWASTSPTRRSPSSASATCRATCSATGCCSAGTSGSSRRSTTATSSSTRTPTPPWASPSASACSGWHARPGTTTTARSSPRAAASSRARAKAVPVSPEARRALGIDAESLPPSELIQAILRAPVDLLWSGGVGTYVKHSEETHAEAGDRSNDGVRVDGDELRCRVVGEGGNLGFTQLGRVEYALDGGRIFTDAIDNAGGVNCSDHEVNIKILAARRDRGRVARRRRPRRAAGRDARRGRRPRHRGEPRAGPRAVARASRRHASPRRARRGHPHPGGTRRARPRPGGAARRRGAGEPARLRRRASPSPSWRSCWPTPR